MFKVSYVFAVFLLTAMSCVSPEQDDKKSVEPNLKTDDYVVGDCLEFKERIRNFGLIFLERNTYPDGEEFNLFPVKLDTTKVGIDRFKFGKVYITSFTDFTTNKGNTEGFKVYHFLSQRDFKIINSFFNYIGNVQIKGEYKNVTGGTIAENYEEFDYHLTRWEQMFGRPGRLVDVSEILE